MMRNASPEASFRLVNGRIHLRVLKSLSELVNSSVVPESGLRYEAQSLRPNKFKPEPN